VILAALGLLFIGIAIVGVALPGIPTTGPLIAASWLLTKSCPALERKLLGLRLFRGYRHYLDGSTPMPRRARYWALGWMWTSILISSALLLQGGKTGLLVPAGVVAMGAIGTVVILGFRRHVQHVATSAPPADASLADSSAWQNHLLGQLQERRHAVDQAHPAREPSHGRPLPTFSLPVTEQETLPCKLS